MDMLIVVIEPGLRSIQTAMFVRKMSIDLGIRSLSIVLNKVRDGKEKDLLESKLKTLTYSEVFPTAIKVRESDLKIFLLVLSDKTFSEAIQILQIRLLKITTKQSY
jgi:CO dehydrogenase maturation factor